MRNGLNTSLAAICSLIIFSASVSAITSIAESPPCAKKCESAPKLSDIPLCALSPIVGSPKGNETDLKNTFSCLCTDKKILQSVLPCMLKECASDTKAIEVWFTQTYDECNKLGGVQYPSPPDFLKALNIAVPANVTIPTTITGVPQATSFPSSTATTIPLSAVPTQLLLDKVALALASDAKSGASDQQSVTTGGGTPFDRTVNGAASDGATFGVPIMVAGVLAFAVML